MSLAIDARRLALGGRTLVAGQRIHVEPGTVHTVMGTSGSGKSSLLAAIAGTLAPAFQWDGTVVLDGVCVDALPTERRRIGLLFQDDLLFPHFTVRENLLFAAPAGERAVREAAIAGALERLEMRAFADADPRTLSGGQRQRVALMRALLAEPRALLLDEPFSRLDRPMRARLRTFVFDTLRERGVPALLVTHDEEDIADASAVTRLSDG